jgi:TonB family protein
MKIAMTFLWSLIFVSGFSQKPYLGRVCDSETKLPLRSVNVIMDSAFTRSNAGGFFQIIADTTKVLRAELKGYEGVSFRIPSVEKFVFYLKKIESEEDTKLMRSFYTYLGENLRYPSAARRSSIQGTAVINFEIDTLGKVLSTEIVNKVGGGCSDEVVRVLKKAPNIWYKVKINTKFSLPVTFLIDGLQIPKREIAPSLIGVTPLKEIVVKAMITRVGIR